MIILAFLYSFLVTLFPFPAIAADCIETNSSMTEQQLIEIQQSCKEKITASKSDQSTLKQVISTLNIKINLTAAQINQTEAQIKNLEKEIGVLNGVLQTVNQSMGDLTQIYLARVKESYRRYRVNQIDLIFSADTFADYFSKLKYLNTVKAKDQLILHELETSRQDYDQRKQIKLDKQKEVESLKTKLVSQQKNLYQQQKDKQKLLEITMNDEKKFSAILRQANSMIAAMKGFTSGASPLSNQTRRDDWGYYYNQRDSSWFSQTIGNSTEVLGRVGCLIASSAMVATHYGKNITPSDIAKSTEPFYLDTAYMVFNSWTVNGITIDRSPINKDSADQELSSGRPVIVGLNTSVGTHFIVLKGKNDKGYIMNDPYMENGYDKPFSDRYNTDQIFRFDKVQVH